MARLLILAALLAAALFATPAAAGLYGKGSSVIALDSKNFNKEVIESSHVWVVEFYAPWCGHCQRLAPEYEKAATNLKSMIKVGGVNCDEEKQLCGQYGIQGFPTIKIFPSEPTILKSGKATKTPTDYNGERTARAIVETALGHLPVVFKRVASKATSKSTVSLDDFVALEPEQPKALLFSSKSTTAPMFKAAALEFKGRILLGEVKHTDAALVERFGVTQFPTLLVLPKDGEGEPIRFHGTLNRDSLVSFLEEHALPAPTKSSGGSGSSGSGAFDPKVPQVTTQAQLDELCLKKTDGLCFLAFLDFDPEYERSVRDHEANLKILANIKKRAYDAGRPVHVLWFKNSEQSKLRESFGVSDMLPSGMLLSPVRSVYRPLVTGFDEANIWEFIEETQLGKGRLFRYTHTPTVA